MSPYILKENIPQFFPGEKKEREGRKMDKKNNQGINVDVF